MPMLIHLTACTHGLRRRLIMIALALFAMRSGPLFAQRAGGIRSLEATIKHMESERDSLPDLLRNPAPWTIGYCSAYAEKADQTNIIDVWFASAAEIDMLALFPATYSPHSGELAPFGFPKRFTIERLLDDESSELIVDYSQQEYVVTGIEPQLFRLVKPVHAAGLRITTHQHALDPTPYSDHFITAFSEIMAFHGDWNVALGARINVSSDLPFGYVWHHSCLVDGFSLFYPVTGELNNRFNNFGVSTDKLALLFDLGETHAVDELRLWPDARKPNQAQANGIDFPRHIRLELLTEPNAANGQLLYKSSKKPLKPGSGPLMLRIPAATGRYFRLTLQNPIPDFRVARPLRIALNEIELLNQGQVLTRGHRPVIQVPKRKVLKSKREAAQFLTDGQTTEGDILPLRHWVEGLTRRTHLERELSDLQLDLLMARQRERDRLIFSIVLSSFVIFILLILVWLGRLVAKHRWAEIRDRISCDLHDEIGANISSLLQTTELIQETVPQPTEMQKNLFDDAIQTARLTSSETRNFIHFLESDKGCFDICDQIRKIAQRMLGTIAYRFEFGMHARFGHMTPSEQWDLLMFVKEAFNNIIKHADATHVHILTRKQTRHIQLIISDDGKGIPGDRLPPQHLAARAQHLNATLEIETGLNEGTRLILTLE
jgi:signal transduction histidine kinase